ncbi:sugar-binding domain-containing protein [Arenibacter lacus]|uniref:sugar-binding domain-containing protein n=1 Tax=Arenibacter lacus TaxID=2608629 RepID=UPI00123CAF36|nr:sugar-binding domain-containing protein [Arenibacter lacus]
MIQIFRVVVIVCMFLISALLGLSGLYAQETDFFAEIGNKIQNERMSLLEEKLPPKLPEIEIPLSKGKKYSFKEVPEISTKKELYKELEVLKKKFLPFMENKAPEIKATRDRVYLSEFQWREETPEDRQNFKGTLNGEGQWKNVQVPHFDAPYGRATTYYYKKINISREMLQDRALFIHFKAVDYKAHVFFNGAYVGSHEGFFAPFEFNVSKYAKEGENELLIQVENDYTTTGFVAAGKERFFGDKIYGVTGLGYDNFYDGGHQGAAGMGIYQDCYLESRDPIHINDVFVRPLYDQEMVEVRIEVNNYHEDRRPISFNLSIFGQNFESVVVKDSLIVPSALHIPGIGDLQKPTDWQHTRTNLGYGPNYFTYYVKMPEFRSWSNDTPWLYQAQINVLDENDVVVDAQKQTFGMRSFTMDTVSIPKGRMYFNNKKIRLRGANTMGFLQQDVFKKDWDQLIDDILLAKLTNMNFLRMTQRPVQPEIYEYADMLGLMLQTDFPTFGGIRYNQWEESVRQVSEMERLIRNHPSNVIITYINERFPNGEGHPHRNMATPEQYFSLFRAMDEAVLKENPDRVIKKSDGDYDPPTPGLPDNHCYNTWYNGQGLGIGKLYKGYWQWVKPDWYYGCGEFGAEALDPVEVMEKYYPKEWLPKDQEDDKNWTANRIYAAQTHKFHYMWYNTQHSLQDWVDASQDHQEWALETVTEAFRRDSSMVTFAAHLFIDAWPAGWMKTIMDVDRNPKKGYFAYRNALKPTIVSIRSDRKHFYEGEEVAVESWIAHDPNTSPKDYYIKYQLEHGGKIIQTGRNTAEVPHNSSKFQGFIKFNAPQVKKRTPYILRAAVFDGAGNSVDQTTMDIDVFPSPTNVESSRIGFLGKTSKTSTYLRNHIGGAVVPNWEDADVIWVSSFADYDIYKEELENLAKSGKKVILYNVPVGDHYIGGTSVKVQNTSMGSYYFTSPQTGHRFTENAKPFDFKMWYDEEVDYITPFLDKIVLSDHWSPILSTGNTNWVEDQGAAMAAGELKIGAGSIIICQLDIINRLKTNPVAHNFVWQLIFN